MTKILDAIWFTPQVHNRALPPGRLAPRMQNPCIGIVAFMSHEPTGQWKAYIGYGMGIDEGIDAQSIVRNGVPLGSKEAALGFFPHLDADIFRY